MRLWPLSNNARSKQFLKILRDDAGNHVSMVQRTFDNINKLPFETDVTIACNATHENSIKAQVDGDFQLVIEPERRDTAPAIMLACSHLHSEQGANEDDTVIVMPIDTYADKAYYDSIGEIDAVVQSDASDFVLLGVKPLFPSTKYGYIVPKTTGLHVSAVSRFVEKPSESEATKLIEQNAFWNCGVFAFKLGRILKVIEAYDMPVVFGELRNKYRQLPKNSFDYEVMETADSISVVSYAGMWKDLGTWNTLTEEMADSTAGRIIIDEETCTDIHAINEIELPMVISGLDNCVVIATPDGILVSDKGTTAQIKPLVEAAAMSRPMYERRRWGEYRVIDYGDSRDEVKFLVKELVVNQGEQLSYQKHFQRKEVWTIVSGNGEVVVDGVCTPVASGDVITIEIGQKHSVRANSELQIVETQIGVQLIEEDIERFGNYWN